MTLPRVTRSDSTPWSIISMLALSIVAFESVRSRCTFSIGRNVRSSKKKRQGASSTKESIRTSKPNKERKQNNEFGYNFKRGHT